jgi:amino acid adenylation domain-containing protein/non-ribosomal peptide synthase protein (TIGR01720 family)
MTANPEQRISRLSLLSQSEREQILYGWNSTRVDYGPDRCLHDIITRQARSTPQAVALIFEGRTLSYLELCGRSNQVAHFLRKLGVGPESRVGLLMDRSLELVVAMLGALKAGGAYLPLDVENPRHRLEYMLEDAGVEVVIADERMRGAVETKVKRVVVLEEEWEKIRAESKQEPRFGVGPDNGAYVIYTSGSTGKPKGVVNTHRGIVNRLIWMQEAFGLKADDRVLQKTPYSFDVSVWEFFWPLMYGAGLVMARPEGHKDPGYLIEVIEREQITTLHFVPSMLQAFVRSEVEGRCGSVGRVMSSGEALSKELEEEFHRRMGADLHNLYGPTEAAVDVSWWACERGVGKGAAPIGRPIANTELYVLDVEKEPVPGRVSGELYISGKCLSRGYLGRADLTAEKFVPNPHSEDAGARMYRTGDVARHQHDGNIEYLGRIDRQVKLRGYRIELGEIESALMEHSGVREAVVVAKGDEAKRLVAYLVSREGERVGASELREYLKVRLPDYMAPSTYVWLEKLPVTGNGKLDRAALPEADEEAFGRESEYVAPRGPVEELLAEIWSQALGVKTIGVHDNFFELGGDSILTIQIVAKASQAGLSIAPRDLFQRQTIAELASAAIRGNLNAEQGIITGPVLLTPIQRWFFERNLRLPNYFNQAVLLESRREIDLDTLERVVQALVFHHDSLRLRFVRNESEWSQFKQLPNESSFVSSIDLTLLSPADQADALSNAMADAQATLNLSDGPVMRVVRFRRSAQPDLLLFVIHHLVVDGVSWRILLEDLQTGYEQALKGETIRFPRKTTSFKEWSKRLSQYAHFEMDAQTELQFWVSRPWEKIRPIPLDLKDGPNIMASAQTLSASLTEKETGALLMDLPRMHRTQIQDVLLAALARTLKDWVGADAILVDLEGHGREELIPNIDLSRTVGWFTTIFPVVLEVTEYEPAAILGAVKDQLSRVPNNGITYGVLRYLSNDVEIVRELRQYPKPEVSFNYLGQFDNLLKDNTSFVLANKSAGPSCDPEILRPYLLEINGIVLQKTLKITWTYSRNIHHQETIERLAQSFMQELRRIISQSSAVSNGKRTPSDFPLARLDQKSLDGLVGNDTNIEDIYPLSPMQEGMLFDTVLAKHSTVYCQHLRCQLQGPLRVEPFRQAWQLLMARHPTLRTSLAWKNLAFPLQVVHRQIAIPWRMHDLRGLPDEARQHRLNKLIDPAAVTQFDLSRAPLCSLTLIQVDDELCYFVWTFHHVILDGWSLPVLFKELLVSYSAYCKGEIPELPPAPAYKDFVAWIQQRDVSEAEKYWRKRLEGFTAPTVIKTNASPDTTGFPDYRETVIQLRRDLVTQVRAVARDWRLTIGTVLQGAWALVLSHFGGSDDVLYGVITSGRPATLSGIDRAIGMFINTLPLRVTIDPDIPFFDLLFAIQNEQAQSREYEYCSVSKIQKWSQIPQGAQLFENIFLFQNYPAGTIDAPLPDGLKVQEISHTVRDDFPTVLSVSPRLILHLQYDRNRINATTAEIMLGGCERIFQEIVMRPSVSAQCLRDILKDVEKQFKDAGVQQAEKAAIEKLRLRKGPRTGTRV